MSGVNGKFGPQVGRLTSKSSTEGLHSTSPVVAIGRSVTASIVADRTPGVVTGDDDKFSRPPMTDSEWKAFCKALLAAAKKTTVRGTGVLVSGVTTTPIMIHVYIPAGQQEQLRSGLTFVSRRHGRDILLTFGTVELISSALPLTIRRAA